MIRILSLFALIVTGASCAAKAACIDEIRNILKAHDASFKNLTAKIETSQNGKVLIRTNAWYLDYENNMFETVGRSYWTMIRGPVQYVSSNGKTWRRDITQPAPNWVETSKKEAEIMRQGITEPKCLGEQTKDGKAFRVYSYLYEAKKPFETKSRSTLFVDAKSNQLIHHNLVSLLNKPETLIRKTYMHDQPVKLPDPKVK